MADISKMTLPNGSSYDIKDATARAGLDRKADSSHTHTKSQITDFPTIPTKTSQLTNDSGFKTTDNNTTYSLSKSGNTITLTGSDGSKTSVTDNNTTYNDATTSTHGLMSVSDKKALDVLKTPYATCATGRATADKVATLANFTLTAGATIIVKFTDTNDTTNPTSGNLTLNVNNTGAKLIVAANFDKASKRSLSYYDGTTFCNNNTHIFTYNGSYWQCIDWYPVATTYASGLMSASDKAKLNDIAPGANKTVVDSALSSTSTNPVQNKVINSALAGKAASSHTHDDRYYTESEINTKLSGKLNTSLKGAASGLAELDSNGKVPSAQLPSYVDDVLEYKNKASFPATGESGKIYISQDNNKTYRWSGSAYVEISPSLALGETSATAYRGDRGKVAYDHSQAAHAPSNAEANQNAFSNVVVGSTTIAADSKTDTLTLVAGSNITITPDATNNKVTIASTNTWRGIQNNLTSDSTTDSLSAAQGKVLKGLVDGKAASSHTHSDYALKSKYGDTTIDVGRKANTTVGKYSTAEGRSTTASGDYSHAEGYQTTASRFSSHAEGRSTTASGDYSHAEGYHTTASGNSSYAEGYYTTASGNSSHAGGAYTKALHNNEVAFGYYNESNDDTLFSVGDGTADDARKNAFEITTSGGKLHDKDILTSAHCIQFIPHNMKYYAQNDRILLFSNDDVLTRGIYFVNNTPNDVTVCALISASAEGPTVQYGYGSNTYPDIQNTGDGREWFSEKPIPTSPTIFVMTVPSGKLGYYGVYHNSETVYTTFHDIRCPYFNYF